MNLSHGLRELMRQRLSPGSRLSDMSRQLPFVRLAFVLLASFFLSNAQAQTGFAVAGFGYRTPSGTITAAPGQVLTVSVFGIAGRFPTAILPVAGSSGLPTVVGGISADFVQGPVTVQLQIRAVQQTACPASGQCSPATAVTIQIPYELSPESNAQATVHINEGGAMVAAVAINGVPDSVHVINTCDQTGIFLSAAFGVPADSCMPMVMHANGVLVSGSHPAAGGETLILWAYGLGALDHPLPTICCSSPSQVPLTIQPFTLSFSYDDPGRVPLRRLAQGIPLYAGMPGGGVYQVLVAAPPAPSDLSPCSGPSGNLHILLSGPSSADGAEVCMQ
jgi:uncharacterized protein (TIGR03437 family)